MPWCFKLFSLLLFSLFSLSSGLLCQDIRVKGFRFMSYNVENLFDIYDDSLKEDNDFLPEGVLRWNYTRYIKKLNSVYKTISAAGEWNIPAVIALCEVENRGVLEDLIYKTYLSKYNIGIIHEDSPDPRGIDVCMLYRKDLITPLSYRYLMPVGYSNLNYRTRTVLYAQMLINNDTLHVIVNHWPSRRAGVLAGDELRTSLSGMVRELCDSLFDKNKEVKIIICGDFNCTPEDNVIRSLLRGKEGNELINLASSYQGRNEGTYRYRGTWEMIDQVIVSRSLLNHDGSLFINNDKLVVFNPEFLLDKDEVYPGFSPYPTYRGYRYHGGFSDHLPVIVDFKVNCRDQ